MLYDNLSHLGVGQQGEELRTLIIDARATPFDDFVHQPPLCVAPTDEPFGLPLQVVLVLARRDTSVQRHGASRRRAKLWRIDDHGAGRQLIARKLPPFPHAPGAILADADCFRVARQLHVFNIAHVFRK